MSGVCGIVQFDGTQASAADIGRMLRTLGHLGEDASTQWHDGPCALGALRTNITVEDRFDSQPCQAGYLTLVCDARLDNREELAQALDIAGADLATMPDSALLLAAWQRWGEMSVERLIGDFVFAVWDASTRELWLCRDHMGQRHVVFHHGGSFFAFATEHKGLWALPQVPRVLTEKTVAWTLSIVPGGRWTDTDDPIDAVRGGSLLRIDAQGKLTVRRYWVPHADPQHENKSEAYYIDAYRRVLGEAVACRLRRTIDKAGLLMSGGFDSSAICALAEPVASAQNRKFVTATSVVQENAPTPAHMARKWVETCRRHMPYLDVHYVTREGMDALQGLEQAFHVYDKHYGPNRYVNDGLYGVLRRAGVRVVMDGHGGDYTLNQRGDDFLWDVLRTGHLGLFFREWNPRRRFLRLGHRQLIRKELLSNFFPRRAMRRARRAAGLPEIGSPLPISDSLRRQTLEAGMVLGATKPRSKHDAKHSLLCMLQNAPINAGSVPAAAHGLEFTQPFHDKRVVELALAIPTEMAFKNGRDRYLARRALSDLYPPEYQERHSDRDNRVPDFADMAERVAPQMLAEIDRMEQGGKLEAYFDFTRLRALITQLGDKKYPSVRAQRAHAAMFAFICARYIEWFRGLN